MGFAAKRSNSTRYSTLYAIWYVYKYSNVDGHEETKQLSHMNFVVSSTGDTHMHHMVQVSKLREQYSVQGRKGCERLCCILRHTLLHTKQLSFDYVSEFVNINTNISEEKHLREVCT